MLTTEGLPVNHARMILPTPLAVLAVEQENYRTKTLVLDGRLPATPGQFVMAWLPRFDEKPFSLVCADPVTLMVTAVGPFSRLLHDLVPGQKLWIRGPFGQGYARPEAQRRLALVGGGYGVAPLLWLARTALAGDVEQISVIIGARTADDLLYAARFQALAAESPHGRLQVEVTTEDGSQGVRGRVTDVLEPILAAGGAEGIYACGPHAMLDALARLGSRYGIPGQLSWEAYMRCGIGICGACEHAGQVLCLDGPVLHHEA
jgi:dihydroorotate dehydrogenase electron transfer subunit